MRLDQKIPLRVTHILNLFAIALGLIFVRVWFLSVVQKEKQYQESLKPQRRTIIEPIERATIRDRFNIPLAVNKIQYNAAVCYSQIRQIPSVTWEKIDGKRVKKQVRRTYIKELAHMLGERLDLDPTSIEDLIHAKASLFPSTPFVIKEGISEKEYYALKMLERSWRGVQAVRTSKRSYPFGKIGGDVIGYLGSISEGEYWNIAEEISRLKEYTQGRDKGELAILPKGFSSPFEVRKRLSELLEKGYTINDQVGKGGIEKQLDEELRGKFGKKKFEIDTNGNFLRELPGGRQAIPGRRAVLSLSIELQAYAEKLLATYEFQESQKEEGLYTQPWIRGGAIVAMDPKTGEVIALASHPRFDPNDFTHQNSEAIEEWLELEAHVAAIWNGARPISKELFDDKNDTFQTQTTLLTWPTYLQSILSPQSSVSQAALKIDTLKTALHIQQTARSLLTLSRQGNMRALIDVLYPPPNHTPSRNHTDEQTRCAIRLFLDDHLDEVSSLSSILNPYLTSIADNNDKLLFLDLCQLAAYLDDFPPALSQTIGALSPSTFFNLKQELHAICSHLKKEIHPIFKKTTFATWRENHFKEFLKEKRKIEKENKWAARPYIEYLEKEERSQFAAFWDENASALLTAFILGDAPAPSLKSLFSKLPPSLHSPLLFALRPFDALTFPLFGKYHRIQNSSGQQLGKHLAAGFYPQGGFGYGRSFAYRQSTPAGSIFKLITGYEALRQKYEEHKALGKSLYDINPLTLVDSIQWAPKNTINSHVLGYTEGGQPIRRLYKRGLLPRGHANIGRISLPEALEHSSNIYFSILAGDHLRHPNDLANAARLFGYGSPTHIELPGEIPGNIPDDLTDNRTGLYAFAIGQHSLVVTPLQTALMLSSLANHGTLLKPRIVRLLASVEPPEGASPFTLPNFAFSDALSLIGITFPLFTEAKTSEKTPYLHINEPQVRRTLFLPEEIRRPLLSGMHRVIHAEHGLARTSVVRTQHPSRQAANEYIETAPYLIGKTGTAEFFFKPTLDSETKATIHNHIWFGSIAYTHPVSEQGPFDDPELIVVVYLQQGDWGRKAAPLAGQIVKKWREIKAKRKG